jgi:hypothetical protein
MGTKLNPGKFDCYHAAADDEPMFVLLARDPAAPILVEMWCALRKSGGLSFEGQPSAKDEAKIAEAKGCAEAMREWRRSRHD